MQSYPLAFAREGSEDMVEEIAVSGCASEADGNA